MMGFCKSEKILAMATILTLGEPSQCPSPNGVYADAIQCDKYLSCVDDKATEKLCPDGLVFNSASPLYERCDLPYMANCKGREERQAAQPTEDCPRQNGLFHYNCTHFTSCKNGESSFIQCPEGLVFYEPSGHCDWLDVAQRPDCEPTEILGFECPDRSASRMHFHEIQTYENPRFRHATDCKKFYICMQGVTPRLLACPEWQVFNDQSLQCDQPDNVIGCETYYIVQGQPNVAKPSDARDDFHRLNGK